MRFVHFWAWLIIFVVLIVAAPLTNLTKKFHVWAWTGKCQDAFEKLKHLLTEAPLLRISDSLKPIVWLRMLLIFLIVIVGSRVSFGNE
jgi:hypothetical protein